MDAIITDLVQTGVGNVFAFVWGALWGSFANVCVVRIPRKMSVVRPPSRCFACGADVAWYDNLPVLSWLILGGKCRRCKAKFSVRYALVELMAGLLTLGLWQHAVVAGVAGDTLAMGVARFFILFLFVMVMLVLAFIDLDTKLLPDVITLPSIVIFYFLGLLLPGRPWWDGVIGIAAGYLFVRLLADGYYLFTRREGMGYGDGKLLAVVGALLGWRALPFTIFVGSLAGTLIAIPVLVVQRRRAARAEAAPRDQPGEADADADAEPEFRHIEVPFGPFLAMGAVAFVFLGAEAIRFWFG